MGFSKEDFKKYIEGMKERIPVGDVYVKHTGVRLKVYAKNPEYAIGACPLPTHPKGDARPDQFSWHMSTNKWNCYHPRCRIEKWGDCINLVEALYGLPFTEACKQLERWFPNKNPAPLNEAREEVRGHTASPTPRLPDHTRPAIAGKDYMKETRAWLVELLSATIPDQVERMSVVKLVMDKIYESYRNGMLKKSSPAT